MRVALIGPPGCGKGTQAKLLQERLGLTCIGTGDILREAIQQQTKVGKRAEPFVAQGKLVPDDIVNTIVADRLKRPDRPTRFVIDGYPRTAAQAVRLDAVLKELKLRLDAVVHFLIDEDEVVRRLLSRGRTDDTEETVRERLRVFHETAAELLNYYRRQGLLREVPAGESIEGLYAKIASLLQPTA
jgi:adenylate kinase